MTKTLLSLVLAMASLAAPLAAHANDFADVRTAMSAARESLVTMLTNKTKRDAEHQKVVADTANAVSAKLAKLKAPAGKEAQFKELVDTWNAFKKTREADLVPAILAGRDDEARKLAGGIQRERITRCQQLLSELGA